MANFIVISPGKDDRTQARDLFRQSLNLARILKRQEAMGTIENGWSYAAVCRRRNGSGSSPVTDIRTGCWLISVGSWFHNHGFSVGEESRLLERYLEVGQPTLAHELEGFFIIVVGDSRTKDLWLITDIIGSCHAFMRRIGQTTVVAGSSLLLAAMAPYTLDDTGCREFLDAGVIYEDRTIYREVRKVGPAAIYRIRDGIVEQVSRYWRASDIRGSELEGHAATEMLWGALTCAASRIGKVFPHPVCDLTGGYDSRSVVAAFQDANVRFSTTVSGPASSGDVKVAHGLAKLLNLPLLHLAPRPDEVVQNVKQAAQLTDGEYDIVEYAQVLSVHRTLMDRFHASVNGSFGEVARGYWWELLFPHAGERTKLDALRLASRRYATQMLDSSIYARQSKFHLASHMADVIERANAGIESGPNTSQMDHAYLVMRMQRWQGRIASSTDQLWPCLSPFMFRSVLEAILRVSPRCRRRSLLIRSMLSEFSPVLADYPLEFGYPARPLTWDSFYRFWPIPVLYAKKVMKKLVPGVRASGFSRSQSPKDPLPRLWLWKEQEVQAMLQPRTMRSRELYDCQSLDRFLVASRQDRFAFGEQWARILSLEWALSELKGVSLR